MASRQIKVRFDHLLAIIASLEVGLYCKDKS
jgi:hypothetical protein